MPASNDKDSTSLPEAAQTRWQFIDTSKNSRSNLTQVKRHVMQEYMRQKKGDSHQSDEETDAPKPRKRGRPRKADSNRRESTRKWTSSKNSSIQPKPSDGKSSSHSSDEDAQGEINRIDHTALSLDTSASSQSMAVYQQTFPFRPSPDSYDTEPQDFLFSFELADTVSGVTEYSSDMNEIAGPTYVEPTWSPKTIMSAARTDPFNSLPLELDLDGQRLFDFYVNDMPSCSYGGHYRSNKAHNWYRMVFVPEGMRGGVAFQNTILVHAANTWAWVHNETETTRTLLHRDRALTMLREYLKNDPYDDSDVAIISCLSAAALEDFDPRPGHKEISWMHMRAARNMIRSRGGPSAFAHTRLGMLINWQDYILSGYETHGPSFSFESTDSTASSKQIPHQPPPSQHFHNMPSPPSSIGSPPGDSNTCPTPRPSSTFVLNSSVQESPIDEIRLQCEVFLDFLRRCEQLALYQRDHPEACDVARRATVQEASILFRVIAAPPRARFTASGDRKQMVSRLTTLIMLNAGLWDYRYTPILAGTFMKTLERAMINSEVSMSGSVEAILQILLECNDGIDHGLLDWSSTESLPDYSQYSSNNASPSSRPWFAGRMLKIAKRLSPGSWHRLNDMLFSCLTLQTSEPSFCLWEADLRREILDAPLTSYIMPSLL